MLNLVKQAEKRAKVVKVGSKHRIYTVLDIAGYIVNTNLYKGIRIRRKRLDMYLYFIQLFSILRTGKPMFDSFIYVRNTHWPYTEWVDNHYGNEYRIKPIPRVRDYWSVTSGVTPLGKRLFNPHITMSDRQLMDDFLDVFNAIPMKRLKYFVRTDGLTKQAIQNHDRIITEKMMRECSDKLGREIELYTKLVDACLCIM